MLNLRGYVCPNPSGDSVCFESIIVFVVSCGSKINKPGIVAFCQEQGAMERNVVGINRASGVAFIGCKGKMICYLGRQGASM
jgi:hypothetical protein